MGLFNNESNTIGRPMSHSGKNKELRKYICDWPGCNHKFKQYISSGDQVVCPNCKGGLKT